MPQKYVKLVEEVLSKFQTGKPVTISYMRNTASSKKIPNDPYQQEFEPAGIYMSQGTTELPGYETGTITFEKPLVIPFNSVEGNGYDDTSWKMQLYKQYNLTGKNLSKKLASFKFDGIITYDKYGTSEIVSLKPFLKKSKNK